jgi:hypothetical protein
MARGVMKEDPRLWNQFATVWAQNEPRMNSKKILLNSRKATQASQSIEHRDITRLVNHDSYYLATAGTRVSADQLDTA